MLVLDLVDLKPNRNTKNIIYTNNCFFKIKNDDLHIHYIHSQCLVTHEMQGLSNSSIPNQIFSYLSKQLLAAPSRLMKWW